MEQPAVTPPPKKPRLSPVVRDRTAKIILAVLVVISLSFVGGWLGARVYLNNPNQDQQTENARRVVNEESQLISNIASEVGPSVVSVNVVGASSRVNPFTGQAIEQESAGTGFIISDQGFVLTNRHVVPASVSKVTVTLADGTVLDNVSVVGRTSDSDSLDVAFLKINDAKGKTLKPVVLGDSDKMKVGDMVIAIGNALGEFQNSVTSGIISGYGRSVAAQGEGVESENLQNLFQTDAAINQGNSGGPLVNSAGEVIAINTAVATGEAENIGFAIPINDALGLIQGIIEKGQVLRPYIGVRYVQLDSARAAELGVTETEGAFITEDTAEGPGVLSNSPAAAAGLRAKDIITEVNGTKVTTKKPLTAVVSRYPVGEKVTITYIRDGKKQTVELTLQAMPN